MQASFFARGKIDHSVQPDFPAPPSLPPSLPLSLPHQLEAVGPQWPAWTARSTRNEYRSRPTRPQRRSRPPSMTEGGREGGKEGGREGGGGLTHGQDSAPRWIYHVHPRIRPAPPLPPSLPSSLPPSVPAATLGRSPPPGPDRSSRVHPRWRGSARLTR